MNQIISLRDTEVARVVVAGDLVAGAAVVGDLIAGTVLADNQLVGEIVSGGIIAGPSSLSVRPGLILRSGAAPRVDSSRRANVGPAETRPRPERLEVPLEMRRLVKWSQGAQTNLDEPPAGRWPDHSRNEMSDGRAHRKGNHARPGHYGCWRREKIRLSAD
jgi:hypothetical protein